MPNAQVSGFFRVLVCLASYITKLIVFNQAEKDLKRAAQD